MNKQLSIVILFWICFSLFSMEHPYKNMDYHDPRTLHCLVAAAAYLEGDQPPRENHAFLNPEIKLCSKISKTNQLFKCTLCQKAFKSFNGLKVHRADHAGKHRYECPPCSYATNNPSNFKSHLKSQRHFTQLQEAERGLHLKFVMHIPGYKKDKPG